MTKMTIRNRILLLCAVLLCALTPPTFSSDTPSPLYAYNQGSYVYSDEVPLLRSYSGVFPKGFVRVLVDECRNTNQWEKQARDPNLKDSKAATNWASMAQIRNPRSAAEMAVAILYKFAFPDGIEPAGGIAGGEWWVQMRNSNENIGFHVDKDEGIASEEQWMKMPVLSTVTYLTDVGGPTLVLNQSSNRGGNRQEPELPVKGIFVYPKKNRHMLFRGNLQHGVVGEFGAEGGERITFLVNWWDKRPMAPYCMNLSDEVVENHIRSRLLTQNDPGGSRDSDAGVLGLISSVLWGSSNDNTNHDESKDNLWNTIQEQLAAGIIGPSSESSHREMPESVNIPTDINARRRVDIQVPPRKRYNFPVPNSAANGTFARKIIEFDWDPDSVGGILHNLDPSSRMCIHLFENAPGIKVIIFRDGRDQTKANAFDHDVSYNVAKAFLHLERSGGPQVYVANPHGNNHVARMFTQMYGGTKMKTIVMVAAMVVDEQRRRTHYRMWHSTKKSPPVNNIVAWVNKLRAKDPNTMQYDEVRSGKRRKRKKGKKNRKTEIRQKDGL